MSSVRVLARNIFSNWVGYAVQLGVGLLITPFVLHAIGDTRYGVWALISGITGYYGLLDAGFRVGLTRFITRYRATKDYEQMNGSASTGFAVLCLCALALLATTLLLTLLVPLLFQIPGELVGEVRLAIVIVGASAAIQFIFFVYSAVFTATQRFDLSNAIGIASRLLTALLTYIFVSMELGLIGVCLATAIGNVVDYLARWRVAYRLLPQLRVSLRLANMKNAWEFLHFSLWNMATDSSRRLIFFTDAIVIGFFLPPAAIARFALASNISNHLLTFFRPMGAVFFPYLTELDARQDHAGIRKAYLAGTRLLTTLAVIVGIITFIWAEDFYRLWIGSEFTLSSEYPPVHLLFHLLLPASVLASCQRVGGQVLIGMGSIRLRAVLLIAEAVLNLGLSLALVSWLGLIGVALGTLLPALLFQGVIQPVVVGRQLELPFSTYLWQSQARPLLLGLLLAPPLIAIHATFPVTNLGVLVVLGVSAGILGVLGAMLVVLSSEERQRYIVGPFILRRVQERY